MADNTEFDFGSLAPAEVELPKREGGRTRVVQDNPFVPWVSESYNTKTGRAVEVPNEQVKRTEYLIRQAAEDLGIGVRIVCSLDKDARAKAPKNKKVKVSFQGQEKKRYGARKPKSTDTADVVASPGE